MIVCSLHCEWFSYLVLAYALFCATAMTVALCCQVVRANNPTTSSLRHLSEFQIAANGITSVRLFTCIYRLSWLNGDISMKQLKLVTFKSIAGTDDTSDIASVIGSKVKLTKDIFKNCILELIWMLVMVLKIWTKDQKVEDRGHAQTKYGQKWWKSGAYFSFSS